MDPGIPVPPKEYGGHERLVYMFAKEYHRLGHEITLLVGPGSVFNEGTVITFGNIGYPKSKSEGIKDIFKCWGKLIRIHKQFDLIHNFGRLAYLLPVLNKPVTKIMTYGREISGNNILRINKLPHKKLVFTGCSKNLISRGATAGQWKAVYNAIEFDKYQLVENIPVNAPLVFLGRLEKIKGVHHAIAVAKQTGDNLILAGNISNLPEERKYWDTEIAPQVDGVQIQYVGALDDEQKNKFLGMSKAMLFPIDWNEPFGMVMVEAMACGTPVIAFSKGSVPEVIDEGITGFIVTTPAEMADAVKKIKRLDRSGCRQKAYSRFDVSKVAAEYLSLVEND